jgi:argininosuccinate lyase
LRAAGVLDERQLEELEAAIERTKREFESGSFEFKATDEDIHTAIERRLSELVPDAGPRIHAGRSRNDQVALDLRLYCRDACAELTGDLAAVVRALADVASAHAEWPMPGYTHLQRAQPVTLGHHLLAHAEPLLRDAKRLRDAYQAAGEMPLGAGALAASTLPLERELVARELGFERLTQNSIDAVSDRDFALDLLHACLTISLHLSRFAEDVVLWASAEFGFLRLPDSVTTGSSLMPQKKNPDVAELARGKSGRLIGHVAGMLAMLKGLPLAYDRDLQEDKAALFGSVESTHDCLAAARLLVEHLEFDRARLRELARDPDLGATDRAEELVKQGVPFRHAHRKVGEALREQRQEANWQVENSLLLRDLPGGPHPRRVAERAHLVRGEAEQLAAMLAAP